jgi:WD40 repeat protein
VIHFISVSLDRTQFQSGSTSKSTLTRAATTLNIFREDALFYKLPRMTFQGHEKSVLCIHYITKGNRDTLVLSGGEGKVANLWSLRSGLRVATLKGHDQRICCCETYCTKQGRIFAVTGSWVSNVVPALYC